MPNHLPFIRIHSSIRILIHYRIYNWFLIIPLGPNISTSPICTETRNYILGSIGIRSICLEIDEKRKNKSKLASCARLASFESRRLREQGRLVCPGIHIPTRIIYLFTCGFFHYTFICQNVVFFLLVTYDTATKTQYVYTCFCGRS